MIDHSVYMRRCLDLAARGKGYTAPNPMVGAVIVANGRIIGEGYHERFGEPHAEIRALQSVSEADRHLIPGATIYVSLEPCNHFGKTPPCAQRLIHERIGRVVIGATEPNGSVAGGGIRWLQEAGIEVITGVEETACRAINRHFFTYHELRRPFVTLKWAQSADGFIAAPGHQPVHFTNSISDGLVQEIRAAHTAILVGGRTAIADNPRLTNRSGNGRQPLRIVIDTHANLPLSLNLFDGSAPTLILHFDGDRQSDHCEWKHLDRHQPVADQVLRILFEKHIDSLLVEGGTHTIREFTGRGLWDEMKVFTSPMILQSGIEAPEIAGRFIREERIFDDQLKTYQPA